MKAHTVRYGNSSISWQRVLAPSIKMAKEGIPVSKTLADAISDKNWFGQKNIMSSSPMSKVGPDPERYFHGPIHWGSLEGEHKAQTTSLGGHIGDSGEGHNT